MGEVLSLRMTSAQRALARLREEERAFRAVLEVLKSWEPDRLFLSVFTVYRWRMRLLHRLAGPLLPREQPSAREELRTFVRDRRPP